MLRIKDSKGKTKFVLRDEDELPVSIDQLVLDEAKPTPKKKEEPETEE